MCVLPVKYAVNIYQTLPKAGTIPKPPSDQGEETPTKCYQDLCSRCETLWHFRFGLPTLTNLQDLSLNLPCVTFTKHYHRGGGQGIKPNAPSRVGEYRQRGCHMGSMVKGIHSVAQHGEPRELSDIAKRPGRYRKEKTFQNGHGRIAFYEHGGKSGMATIKYPGYRKNAQGQKRALYPGLASVSLDR